MKILIQESRTLRIFARSRLLVGEKSIYQAISWRKQDKREKQDLQVPALCF